MEQSKLSGGDQVLSTSTFIWDRPDRGEEQGHLQGKSDGSSSTPLQDSSLCDGEARNDFCSISGDFIYRHHVEPRVKLYVPREASFPFPLKYIDVTRATSTSLDVMLDEKPPGRCTWSGERLTRKQTTSRPDNVWPDMWKHVSGASKRKEKQKWAIEKPSLDNARRLCGIFSIQIQIQIRRWKRVATQTSTARQRGRTN